MKQQRMFLFFLLGSSGISAESSEVISKGWFWFGTGRGFAERGTTIKSKAESDFYGVVIGC